MLFILFFTIVTFPDPGNMRRQCLPKHHYWKPYVPTGTYPKDAFSIGVPKNYSNTFVARVTVPYKKWSRVVPAQFVYDHVESPSIYGAGNTMERYKDNMEILFVTDPSNYYWFPIYWPNCDPYYPTPECFKKTRWICHQLSHCCCLVEGGIVWDDDEAFQMYYVGRVIEDGKYIIGRSMLKKNARFGDDIGIYYLKGMETKRRHTNFDVLAYDCDKKTPNCTAMLKTIGRNLEMKSRWNLNV